MIKNSVSLQKCVFRRKNPYHKYFQYVNVYDLFQSYFIKYTKKSGNKSRFVTFLTEAMLAVS